tara:strand:- start:13793 stop:13921 length:129 start_codon:yes stop_codon:yes gene_type:complete
MAFLLYGTGSENQRNRAFHCLGDTQNPRINVSHRFKAGSRFH